MFSKSQGSRRERDFCSLNLRVRDENEIFSRGRARKNESKSCEIERSRYALMPVYVDLGGYGTGSGNKLHKVVDPVVINYLLTSSEFLLIFY